MPRQAREMWSELYDENHWRVADAEFSLKYLEMVQSLNEDERKRLQKAKKLNEQTVLLLQQGQFDQAVEVGQNALNAHEKVLGDKHRNLALNLQNLASAYSKLGKRAKAKQRYDRALKIAKQTYGHKHPHTATIFGNLSQFNLASGRYAEAKSQAENALEIEREVFGESHPDTAFSLARLGSVHHTLGEYPKAERLYQKALKIQLKENGKNHPRTVGLFSSLAVLYADMGEHAKAEPLYQKTLESSQSIFGANREPGASEHDGILTAEEIAFLPLGGADLVTLSACETGLGAVAGGEGLLGVQRAFQVAGARATVASLWNVDDAATQQLMENFYRNRWESGMSKLDALREAQLWMLNHPEIVRAASIRGDERLRPDSQEEDGASQRLAPRYWGAFSISGDWK